MRELLEKGPANCRARRLDARRARLKTCWNNSVERSPGVKSWPKMQVFGGGTYKNREKPQKTCGNQQKPIDKQRWKADCELRYAFPHPHQYWRFAILILAEGRRRPRAGAANRHQENTIQQKGATHYGKGNDQDSAGTHD